MNKEYSVGKKLCAIIIALLMVVGVIPISSAAEAPGNTENAATAATQNEATEPEQSEVPTVAEETTEAPSESKQYPAFLVDGANSYTVDGESGSMTYYDGKTMGNASVEIQLNPEQDIDRDIISAVKASDFSNLVTTRNDVDLSNVLYTVSERGILTVNGISLSNLASGSYKLTIRYKISENEEKGLFEKSFKVVNEAPAISNITYNGEKMPQWSNKDVNIQFEVNSEIINTVTVNGEAATIGTDGRFAYTAKNSGSYKIYATDHLGHPSEYDIGDISIETTPPTLEGYSFFDENDNELKGVWTNQTIKVKAVLSDSGSGVNTASIKVNDEPVNEVTEQDSKVIVWFEAAKREDYKISFSDNAGNNAEETINADEILLDKTAANAEDFTLTFEAAENAGDKVLNFLTFGLYSNNNIKVTVNVNDGELSGFGENGIVLYNKVTNAEAEEYVAVDRVVGTNNQFILKAPENDGEYKSFDLYVEATDVAGNVSDCFSVVNSNVKTNLSVDSAEALKGFSESLYEIVISKLVPSFDEGKTVFGFASDKKIDKNGTVVVAGDGYLSVTAEDAITGINNITANLDGVKKDITLTADEKAFDNKTKATKVTAKLSLSKLGTGEHTASFTAKSNSTTESETFVVEFFVDNTAPTLSENGFTLSNKAEGSEQKWTNGDVDVTFELNDDTGIAAVSYYNSTKITKPAETDLTKIVGENGKYSFKADSYGEYTVVVEDLLGNKKNYKTEVVKIDKDAPTVKADSFKLSESWTSGDVKVTFTATDNGGSGLDSIEAYRDGVKLDNKVHKLSVDVKTGKCSFVAEEYGDYSVKLIDKMNNKSAEAYKLGTVLIDKSAPTVSSVEFGLADDSKDKTLNKRSFGTYSNGKLLMTVTVNNSNAGYEECSPLVDESVNVTNKVDNVKFLSRVKIDEKDEKKEQFSFEITPVKGDNITNTDLNLTISVSDTAGNKIVNKLGDNGIAVVVSEELKEYEVVATLATPSIDDISIGFSNEAGVIECDGKKVYSGDGSFTTKIKDELSGIDKYYTFFVKKESVKLDDSDNITNISELIELADTLQESDNEAVTVNENISDKEKITEKEVSFVSGNEKHLESGEYFAIVAAYNLSGNMLVSYKNFVVDNSVPTVTGIDITTNNSNKDSVSKNGVYSSKEIGIKINFDDGKYSAGVANVILYNGEKKLGESKKGTFTLNEKGQYQLKALVIDKFGNKLEAAEDIKTKEIKVNNNEAPLEVGESFEIVVNSDNTSTSFNDFTFDFEYSNDKGIFKNDKKNGTISVSIENTLSGIKEIQATVIKAGEENPVIKEFTESEKTEDAFSKKTNTTVTVDASSLESGAYVIKVTAYDISGVENSSEKTFYIDKTAPNIESVKYESNENVLDKLFNLLTFGLYSCNDIKVTVTVIDAAPSSGVTSEGIKLTSVTGKEITENNDFKTVIEATPTQYGEYTKSFVLKASDELNSSFYNDLSVTVTDSFGNEQTDNNDKGYTNVANGKDFSRDSFDIVATTIAPTVSEIKAEGNDEYTRASDNSLWFSANPVVSFKVDDNASKIHSVAVKVNDNDVTQNCTYVKDGEAERLPIEFTSFDNNEGENINHLDISLDTSKLNGVMKEGENTVEITATGNNGKESEAKKYTFYVDTNKPTVEKVEFSTANNKKLYGIYNNESVQMTVTFKDPLNGQDDCSKLKKVEIRENGQAVASELIETDCGEYKLTYTVELDESIHSYSFYAEDNVCNSVEKALSDQGIFVDVSEELQEYEVVATLATPIIDDISIGFSNEAGVIECDGKEVYSGDGSFTTKIKDELSGIDKYYTFFVKKESVKLDDSDNITNLSELIELADTLQESDNEAVDVHENISNKKKMTEKDVKFVSGNEKRLESGEYFAIVAAYNLSGNMLVKYKSFVVDNFAPTVNGFDITTTNGDSDSVSNNGVYSSKEIGIKVNFEDGAYSAGVANVILYNGDEEKLGESEDGTFTLTDNGQYQLKALVIDNFGNHLAAAEDIKTKTITANENNLEVGENFELVVNTYSGSTRFSDFSFDFDYSNDKDIFKNDKKNGEISINIENTLSGIKEVKATVTKADEKKLVIEDLTESEPKEDFFSKKTNTTVTVDASSLESGTYEIVVTAYDMGGVQNSIAKTFYIDKTAPNIESVKYESNENALGKLFNLLTFGLYSSNDIKVTVTVTDAAPSSGITSEGIKLETKTGKEITENNDFTTLSEATQTQDGKYTKSFTLSASENDSELEKSFYNDLSVSVTDIFGNEQTDNGGQGYSNVANEQNFSRDDNFEIVATKLAPTVSEVKAKGSDEYTRASDGALWFSANPVVSFEVDDNASKIHSVEVKVNGKVVKNVNDNIVTYIKDGKAEKLPEEFTNFKNNKGENINHLDISLDTSKLSGVMKEGKNTVVITATGNNNVPYEAKEYEFYVDTNKPVVQRFDFADYITQDGNNLPVNSVIETEYGYFFQNETVVTVTATDDIVALGDGTPVGGCGVRNIGLYTQAYNEDKLVLRGIYSANELNQASFRIEANFKGQIYAYADDFVNNNDDSNTKYTPDMMIVETEAQHNANSYVKITKPSTDYRDINGRDLYADNVEVTFEVASTYSGIKTVEYKVESDYDTGNNIHVSSDVNKAGQINDWNVLKKDHNLAVVLQKTITVSNNSNDIKVWVKVTDRSGFSTENETIFSIDKVTPKIEVKYDINEPNKVLGEDFYKSDRTATVTITERNFKPEDFKAKITNTEAAIPELLAGANWTSYTPDKENPDLTVHKASFTFHNDGDYTFDCSFTDLVGRKAQDYGTDKFTIDQTAPKISVSYDLNNSNGYYNATRTATITIEEHNFFADYVEINQNATGPDNSTQAAPPQVRGWTTSGDISKATITFANDGKYSFTVDFKDKALNAAVQDKESVFYIDTKIDKIEIVDVENMMAYNGKVAPAIHYFDNNYESSDYSLKRIDYRKDAEVVTNITPDDITGNGFSRVVAYNDFAKTEENDGIYILKASIKDRAGNTAETEVIFSVNRYGSTFMIDDNATKELVSKQIYTRNAPDIVIKEINVNEVTDPVIQLNINDSTKTLTIGSDYTVKESGSKSNWHSYDYTILKKNFESEGNYIVTVTSTDHFKNRVSNRTAYKETENGETKIDRSYPVSFVVDKTPPIVTISGIDSKQYYEEAVRDVTVTCDDANITAENLKIEFDGKALSKDDYKISETAGSVEIKLTLEADGNTEDRTFKVSITDKAGNNNTDGIVEEFRLSASWFARLLHYNLPIVIAVCVIAVLLIGLGIFFIIKKRKRNNED